MEVKVSVGPIPNEVDKTYTVNELRKTQGVYRHFYYEEQFLISYNGLLIYVPYTRVKAWQSDDHDDTRSQWIPTNQTLTITFKGDN